MAKRLACPKSAFVRAASPEQVWHKAACIVGHRSDRLPNAHACRFAVHQPGAEDGNLPRGCGHWSQRLIHIALRALASQSALLNNAITNQSNARTLAGQISFGRAFSCGILIALITTVCYVATWEVLYFNFMPHFMDSYFAAQIHTVQSSGLDPATAAAQVAAIQHSQQLYQNPFVNMAYTFMEPLPVGLIITLISAVMLRRKAPASPPPMPQS